MMRIVVFACIALGFGLIALLLRASGNNAFFSDHYALLFWIGLGLTIGLTALIGMQVYGLWKKLRADVFGAKLALRLMVVFALMAVIPGGLVYAISVQFLNRSIDSWFDVPVERALQSALDLGKTALNNGLTDFTARVRDSAVRATDMQGDFNDVARQVRARGQFDEVVILNESGEVLATAQRELPGNVKRGRLMPDLPTRAEITKAIQTAPQKSIETGGERTLYYRVLVLIPAAAESNGARVIQVMQEIPKKLAGDAASVENGFRDYQQLGVQRDGLKRLFALTLTLAMVLTLFSAILLSFLLSERLSSPLSALAESTRAIAKGDFTKLNPVKSRDEFGVLTQSFNTMTRQLAEASDVVARKQNELENANTYLESILGNLTSGVLTLDERLYVKSINRNAEEILGFDHALLRGHKLPEWGTMRPALAPLTEEVCAQISSAQTLPRDKPWERQIVLDLTDRVEANTVAGGTGKLNIARVGKRTLLVRGTKLPTAIESGYVLVFDDITGLIQAQRDAAWGEVARRLAHEIKNPLTPIQLSAERLQMKLADKLPPAERDMLSRATHTIVAQVGALKGMVDDFSLYSRSSRLKPGPVDLNELINDVLILYESMHARVEKHLAAVLPVISADPALLRQVIHNLMQNALDSTQGLSDARIVVSTTIHGSAMVELRVSDNGSGIREDVRERIFEPYVTTKPKGTGLGLAIVKKIIDEHGGMIEMQNNVVLAGEAANSSGGPGVSVVITLPVQADANRLLRQMIAERR